MPQVQLEPNDLQCSRLKIYQLSYTCIYIPRQLMQLAECNLLYVGKHTIMYMHGFGNIHVC